MTFRAQRAGVLSAVALASAAQAGVVFVDDDAPAGGDGLSWTTAYRHLQDGLADATTEPGPTEVRVAQGIYRPDRRESDPAGSGDRTATFSLFFVLKSVQIRGGYAGMGAPDPDDRDVEAYETILSGDLNGDDGPGFAGNQENSYHVTTALSLADATVLDGFTITGGNADGAGIATSAGGGMHLSNASPTIRNCTFHGNSARIGGAMYGYNGHPTVTDCAFQGNRAFDDEGLKNGGAMHNALSSPTVTNCTFTANTASGWGGAVFNVWQSNPTFTDCLFTANEALLGGAAANNASSQPAIINCLFIGNLARSGGAVFNRENSESTVSNSIIWDNAIPAVWNVNAQATVIYTDIQGGWPGLGNIDADPMLIDADNGNLRLSPESPCIDAGNNWCVGADAADVDGDGDTAELTPLDLDGSPRFASGAGEASGLGCGVPVIVDMGPYEHPGLPADIVFGDLDGDGSVRVGDLAILVACLGSNEPACCVGDLDVDGEVGILDLHLLVMGLVRAMPAGPLR